MNILLTGGTGFIGNRILKKISDKKNRVLIITRKKIKKKRTLSIIKLISLNQKAIYQS